ncbi:hypothetical protein ACFLZB_04110 [Nanoarchaeota archaeon]
MLKLIIIGILVCLLSLSLLLVMDTESEPVLQSKTYVVGGTGTRFVIENEKIDLFEEWQAGEEDRLNQRKWDCFVGDGDG